ncbi:MAG: CRTAC1 family protein [Candidatus Poribacteria bacterium]|nr:CRTAC1 family protein [Candidatus Poribacteria bacterium]
MNALALNATLEHDRFYDCSTTDAGEVCNFASLEYGQLTTIVICFVLSFFHIPFPALSAEPSIHFTDVTDTAGIYFGHTNGASGEFHLPETLGAGGAFFDYDNDGYLDLYLVDSAAPSVFYRNNGDGTFTDVTASAGVSNQGSYGHGVACGDYDNDGYVDIYVTNFGANRLYHNNGDGTFTDVTAESGTGDARWSSSATFFDYNGDGDLDLYVVNYVNYKLDGSAPTCFENPTFGATEKVRGYCHPKHFEGVPDSLYRNNGDGTFTDVTEAANVRDPGGMFLGKGLGVVAADFNADGNPDLYVANDDTPNYLFYNKGDGTFAEIAILAGCAYSADGIAQAGMGVDAGDYNGDGHLDIFVTNFSYETNTLYRNNGDGTFTDVSYKARLGEESYLLLGFGTGFFDADNDGHLDIFVANGHIFPNVERTTDVISYKQLNQLFLNQDDGTFAEVRLGEQRAVSRGTLFGDYDNDGDIDVLVTQLNDKVTLLRNEGGTHNNWFRLKLVGTRSNRDSIGARVTLMLGDESQTREVHVGYSYLSSNDPRLLFGIGERTVVDRVHIRWQSGAVQILENLAANQEFVVTEPLSDE